ncbi:MAG: Unknown protein [uncultured Aureispira sp.]|uniref:Uncharacterized protein n=1 Tax=uncultured Aureispira sp. TaxID=1331704 RepID=A0A6S6RS18_9BACT|nr:MAG: Unknown protein [uncultured Aureispira sp.]
MEITKEGAIGKIIFWQKITTVVLSLFVLALWGLVGYIIHNNLEYGDYDYIQSGLYLGFCVSMTYMVYLLYQSFSLLQSYQNNQEALDIEMAFNKQRLFWMMGPVLLISSIAVLLFSALFFSFSS